MEKIKDTSQEEIEKGNHIIYPLTLSTGEVVNNKKEFIKSKHWNRLKRLYLKNHRKEYKEKNGYKISCEYCNKEHLRADVQLHHLSYKNVGNENLEELVLICFKCHLKAHGKEEITKQEYESNKNFKKGNLINLNNLILFGKYKNEKLTLKKLIEKDKQYVQWLINNNVIKINEKAKEYFENN